MTIILLFVENSLICVDFGRKTVYTDKQRGVSTLTENICHFIPFRKDIHGLHTINFVLETKRQDYTGLRSESVYKMHYVCSGEGRLHTCGAITPLEEGDIFFTFPAEPFAIESGEGFTYMYISFVGLRGNQIMEDLKISSGSFLFRNAGEVGHFWERGLSVNGNVIALMSESVLLYTFAFLGDRLLSESREVKQSYSIDLVKKYVDDHFSDSDFSLEAVSRELSYNKKYISTLFKKHIGIGIMEYVNTIRIQNACTMIKQGFISISDIAEKCGYGDARYFSKVFKGKMGIAPTEYIKTVRGQRQTDAE